MVAIIIFSLVTLLADILTLKSKSLRDIVEGRATVVIKDGKILEENLKKEKYTIDESIFTATSKGYLSFH